ncbi:unnamed protein product [Arabidopsis halleri]
MLLLLGSESCASTFYYSRVSSLTLILLRRRRLIGYSTRSSSARKRVCANAIWLLGVHARTLLVGYARPVNWDRNFSTARESRTDTKSDSRLRQSSNSIANSSLLGLVGSADQ